MVDLPFLVTGCAYCGCVISTIASPKCKLTYMGLVPLAEGGSVNLDNGTLDESVGSDEFVVGGVVDLS